MSFGRRSHRGCWVLLLWTVPGAAGAEPSQVFAYQEPLYALYAPVRNQLRLGLGFAENSDLGSLALILQGSLTLGDGLAVFARMPVGLSIPWEADAALTAGDMELGVQWLLHAEPATQRHFAVGLSVLAPTSRIGENKDLAGVPAGTVEDTSNFGRRFLLAQKPLLDLGLVPKLNLVLTPYLTLGQNIDRVSLQIDLGCLVLIGDKVDPDIHGTDRRFGLILFYDVAAPVAITEALSIVAEFNAVVALDELSGAGYAMTIGLRHTTRTFGLGAGIQIPLGIGAAPQDDDTALGRYDAAIVVRHRMAFLADLSFFF